MYTLIYTQNINAHIHIYNVQRLNQYLQYLQHIQCPIKLDSDIIYFECFLDKIQSSIINVISTLKQNSLNTKLNHECHCNLKYTLNTNVQAKTI